MTGGSPEQTKPPDPGLAQERTSLAWTRSAIAFAAIGGAILKTRPLVGAPLLAIQRGHLANRPLPPNSRPRLPSSRRVLTVAISVTVVAIAALIIALAEQSAPGLRPLTLPQQPDELFFVTSFSETGF